MRAPGVALVVVGDAAPVVEAGWTSPDYGIKHAAPVVSIVADGAADATFTTLVLPLPEGAAVPDVALRSCDEATALEVTGERFADTICWSLKRFHRKFVDQYLFLFLHRSPVCPFIFHYIVQWVIFSWGFEGSAW